MQNAFDSQTSELKMNNQLDPNIKLLYPNSKLYGHRVFLASHFFGVTLDDDFEKNVST